MSRKSTDPIDCGDLSPSAIPGHNGGTRLAAAGQVLVPRKGRGPMVAGVAALYTKTGRALGNSALA